MRKLLVIACAFVGMSVVGCALAESCDNDTIEKKTDDGEYLFMSSGSVYRVMPGDESDSALWLPSDDVLICARLVTVQGRRVQYFEIINPDEGEKIGALQVK